MPSPAYGSVRHNDVNATRHCLPELRREPCRSTKRDVSGLCLCRRRCGSTQPCVGRASELLAAPRGPQLASASAVAAQGAAARAWQARAGWRRTVNVLLGREGRGFKCSVSWFAKARRRGASHASAGERSGNAECFVFSRIPLPRRRSKGAVQSASEAGARHLRRDQKFILEQVLVFFAGLCPKTDEVGGCQSRWHYLQ